MNELKKETSKIDVEYIPRRASVGDIKDAELVKPERLDMKWKKMFGFKKGNDGTPQFKKDFCKTSFR